MLSKLDLFYHSVIVNFKRRYFILFLLGLIKYCIYFCNYRISNLGLDLRMTGLTSVIFPSIDSSLLGLVGVVSCLRKSLSTS